MDMAYSRVRKYQYDLGTRDIIAYWLERPLLFLANAITAMANC